MCLCQSIPLRRLHEKSPPLRPADVTVTQKQFGSSQLGAGTVFPTSHAGLSHFSIQLLPPLLTFLVYFHSAPWSSADPQKVRKTFAGSVTAGGTLLGTGWA